jgi:hypothetical protein
MRTPGIDTDALHLLNTRFGILIGMLLLTDRRLDLFIDEAANRLNQHRLVVVQLNGDAAMLMCPKRGQR